VLLEIGEDRRKITGLFQRGAGGDAKLAPHLMRDDTGQSRLAKAGRAVEEDVVQRFLALFGGLDINFELRLDLTLTVEISQLKRPESALLLPLQPLFLRRQLKAANDRFLVHCLSPRQRG